MIKSNYRQKDIDSLFILSILYEDYIVHMHQIYMLIVETLFYISKSIDKFRTIFPY